MALLELPHCLMIAGPCWSVPALLVSSSAEGRRTKVDPPPDQPIDRRLCNSKSKNTTSHPTTRSNSRAFRGPSLRPKWTGPGLTGSRRPKSDLVQRNRFSEPRSDAETKPFYVLKAPIGARNAKSLGAVLLAVASAGFHVLISASLSAARDARAATFSERFAPALESLSSS